MTERGKLAGLTPERGPIGRLLDYGRVPAVTVGEAGRLHSGVARRQTPPVAPTLVLHILPVDLARGAQTYAREIRLGLDRGETRHRTLTLFRSGGGPRPDTLRPDYALDVRPGRLRRAGLDPRVVLRLWRLLRAEAPDVVVAHGSEPLKYAVLAGVGRDGLVCYKIGAGHTRLTGIRGRIYRTLLRRAAIVAAVSEAAAAEAAAYGVDAKRLRVIPNGRDPDAYPTDRRPPTNASAPRLTWVGHLDEAKRPLRFVELVQSLQAAGVEVTATVAGDGPLLERVRSAAREVEVAGTTTVDVPGNVADVPALLGVTDVLVLTSAPNEGMPGVLIEAGMAGLPVVTTDVPGASDVVDNGVTGFVVAVDDFDGLVSATRTLIEDAGLRARLGAAARRRCEMEFSLAASMRAWQALLAELTDRPIRQARR